MDLSLKKTLISHIVLSLFLSSGEDGTFLLEHGLKSMYTYHLEAVDAGK